MTTCNICGLLVGDADQHATWHRAQRRALREAATTMPCKRCKGSGRQPGLYNACGRCSGTGEER